MTSSRQFKSYLTLLLLPGCAPAPVVVINADSTTLESLVGRSVTLQGQVELHKAGLVLITSGSQVILEYRGAADDSWPSPGSRIEVTGTLQATNSRWEKFPFRLEHPCNKRELDPQTDPKSDRT